MANKHTHIQHTRHIHNMVEKKSRTRNETKHFWNTINDLVIPEELLWIFHALIILHENFETSIFLSYRCTQALYLY